jgi:hypothetical protein
MKYLWLILVVLVMKLPANGQNRNGAAPDFAVFQFAGSIGYFSVGTGYDIFKSRWRVSAHYGSVPPARGGPLHIITGKLFFEPAAINLSKQIALHPADVGLMVSYHTGDNFKLSVPDYLSSDNYYWWHTSMRVHLAMETSVTCNFINHRPFNALICYVEFNTNDLYIVSYLKNTSSLKLTELIKAGAGVRLSF